MLHVPPVISQTQARLPDGSPDPAGPTDCGEACVASVMAHHTGLTFAPGAIRQALGLPPTDGSTTPVDLARVLGAFGCDPSSIPCPNEVSITSWGDYTGPGRAVLWLNHLYGPDQAHWVLAFSVTHAGPIAMDPLQEQYRQLTWEQIRSLTAGFGILVKASQYRG